jgi:hypothetical protein
VTTAGPQNLMPTALNLCQLLHGHNTPPPLKRGDRSTYLHLNAAAERRKEKHP